MVPEGVEVVRNVRLLVIYYVDIPHMILCSRFMVFSCLKCPAIGESWHRLAIWVWSSSLFGIYNRFL